MSNQSTFCHSYRLLSVLSWQFPFIPFIVVNISAFCCLMQQLETLELHPLHLHLKASQYACLYRALIVVYINGLAAELMKVVRRPTHTKIRISFGSKKVDPVNSDTNSKMLRTLNGRWQMKNTKPLIISIHATWFLACRL